MPSAVASTEISRIEPPPASTRLHTSWPEVVGAQAGPSVVKGLPTMSFSPYGASQGPTIGHQHDHQPVITRPVEQPRRSLRRSGADEAAGRDPRKLAHDAIAVLARGVNRMDRTSAIRFTPT